MEKAKFGLWTITYITVNGVMSVIECENEEEVKNEVTELVVMGNVDEDKINVFAPYTNEDTKRFIVKKNVKYIELVEYDLLGDLDDEEDCLDSFVDDYDSGYICDIISEVADNFIPIYTDEIWDNAKNIREYIAEAQVQGLCEGETDIDKIMMSGFYQYYTQSLYNNLNRMAYNIIAEKVNDYLNEVSEEDIELIDIEQVEIDVNSKTECIDNNDRYEDIISYADEIIQDIKDMYLDVEEEDDEE